MIGAAATEVGTWAELLKSSPYIAIILGLGIVVIVLWRSREKVQTERDTLQQEYRENLVQATSALQALTAEYLKQAFTDSAAWQDRFKGLEDALNRHTQESNDSIRRLNDGIDEDFEKHESRIREYVREMVSGNLGLQKQALDNLAKAVGDIKHT